MAHAALKRRRALVDPRSASAEPFRSLRLALELRSSAREGSSILFTSPGAATGKSTLTGNYALVAALSHGSVLLVDADLRKPAQHELFDVARSPGLVDVLSEGVEPARFAQRIGGLPTLSVLSAGRPIARPGDIASSPRMHELLRAAAASYDVVVVDAPPVLAAADTTGLASHTGVMVVLTVDTSTRRRSISQALRRLRLVDANVAGIVVNRHGRLAQYAY